MKILIIQQKMIGDVLTSTILFEALREKYPTAELHYLINSNTVAVVENNPYIDKILILTPQTIENNFRTFKFLKLIQKEKYDVVIDVYGKTFSTLIAIFSNAKIKIAKHKWYTSQFYSHTFKNVKKPVIINLATENRMRLLEPLDISLRDMAPKIHLSSEEIKIAKSDLEKAGLNLRHPIYMISVLGSAPEKTYPAKFMAEVLNHITVSNENAQLLFNYIPSQKEEARAVFELCDKNTQSKINFDFQATSLRYFLGIVQHCDALVGNEGGAINMAKALKVPTFAIFSPWIRKESWGSKNDPQNIGIHLRDFKPDLFSNYDQGKFKKKQKELYAHFEPEFIKRNLSEFLKNLQTH